MLSRPNIHPDSLFLNPLRGAEQLLGFIPNDAIRAFEMECEKGFIETLDRVNMVAKIKSDRYSLPYKQEIKVVRRFSEYINDAYWINEVYRIILKTLMAEDVSKIRFYFFIRVFDNKKISTSYIEYSFRYTVHRKFIIN